MTVTDKDQWTQGKFPLVRLCHQKYVAHTVVEMFHNTSYVAYNVNSTSLTGIGCCHDNI